MLLWPTIIPQWRCVFIATTYNLLDSEENREIVTYFSISNIKWT